MNRNRWAVMLYLIHFYGATTITFMLADSPYRWVTVSFAVFSGFLYFTGHLLSGKDGSA